MAMSNGFKIRKRAEQMGIEANRISWDSRNPLAVVGYLAEVRRLADEIEELVTAGKPEPESA